MKRNMQVLLCAVLAAAVFVVMMEGVQSIPGFKYSASGTVAEIQGEGKALNSIATALQTQSAAVPALSTDDAAKALANAAPLVRTVHDHVDATIGRLKEFSATDPAHQDFTTATSALGAARDKLESTAKALERASDPSPEGLAAASALVAENRGQLDGIATQLEAMPDPSSAANNVDGIVNSLFDQLVLPFEILGILLTAVMFGALVIARPITVTGNEETSIVHPNTLTPTATGTTERAMPVPTVGSVSSVDSVATSSEASA